jgi:CheY-like chemotaxis protein
MDKRYDILVVDDNPDTRESAAMLLRAKGYTARTAASAVEAVTQCVESPPDLLLLDVHMPVMSGLELLKRLDVRANDYEAVVVTGYRSLADAQRAMELGARSYLTKPVTAESLFEHVAKALAMLEKRRTTRQRVDSLEREVTASREELTLARQVLEHKDLMINALFSSLGEGLMGVDTDENVVLLNPAAEHILDIRFDRCAGRNLSRVIDEVELRLQLLGCIRGFGGSGGTIVKRQDKHGTLRTYLVRTSPFHDRSGALLGQVLNLVDQTDALRNQEHRDSFLTLLAHELRTPVNIIANYASLLRKAGPDHPDVVDIILDVDVTSRRLRDLINGIIGLATVTATTVNVRRQTIDVGLLVQGEVERHRGGAEDRRVSIVGDTRGLRGSTLVADHRILSAAVGALIGNSVKAARTGGSVKVDGSILAKEGEEVVTIGIAGDGTEMPGGARRLLCDDDLTEAVAYGSGKEGIGAGMFLVKRAMELLNGWVEVEDLAEGGERLVLVLPRRIP